MFAAKKPESIKETKDNEKPKTSSESTPAVRMPFTSAVLFSDLYCATYFVIAKFTPQSLNIVMRLGAIKTIETKPYSDGERSLAMIITPTADIIVEAIEPQKRLNPPLAETLAILIAFVTRRFS